MVTEKGMLLVGFVARQFALEVVPDEGFNSKQEINYGEQDIMVCFFFAVTYLVVYYFHNKYSKYYAHYCLVSQNSSAGTRPFWHERKPLKQSDPNLVQAILVGNYDTDIALNKGKIFRYYINSVASS
jgi:hypothetical protein